MKNKADIKKRYDGLYSRGYGHKQTGQINFKVQDSLVETYLGQSGRQLSKEDVVLEIGCGEGNMMLPLCDKVKEIHGVDISEVAITNAKEYLKDKSNFYLYVNDNISFFKDESFDIIFEQTVFQHMLREHVIEYLDQIQKKLKSGGYVLLQFVDDPIFKEVVGTLTIESQSSWTEQEMISEIELRGIKKVKSIMVDVSHVVNNHRKLIVYYLIGRKED